MGQAQASARNAHWTCGITVKRRRKSMIDLETFVDHMGLVVALSGERRFIELSKLKSRIAELPADKQALVKETIRLRFTPTNGTDGCQSAMAAVREAA